jgi:sugar phosphate isomerase/epimerase
VLVAATTACFPDVPFPDVIQLLIDLEFTAVEVAIHDSGTQMTSERIVNDLNECTRLIWDTHRLDISAYDVELNCTGEEYYERFRRICHFAKATKVVTINVPSAEQGTPFNEEIERLQKLVAIGENDGVRIAMRSKIGRMSEDPDTVKNLCDYVPGLGLALDPSQYHCSNNRNRNYDKLMPHVFNVHLRDSKRDKLQVKVGQGEIEYGRIITLLQREGYDRALCVDIIPDADVDVRQELRKLRLLLESLL